MSQTYKRIRRIRSDSAQPDSAMQEYEAMSPAGVPRYAQRQMLPEEVVIVMPEITITADEETDEEMPDEFEAGETEPQDETSEEPSGDLQLGVDTADQQAAKPKEDGAKPAEAVKPDEKKKEEQAARKAEAEAPTAEAEAEAEPAPESEAAEPAPEPDAQGGATRAARRSAGGGGGGANPKEIVGQWQAGVKSAAGGMPPPNLGDAKNAHSEVTKEGQKRAGKHKEGKDGLSQEAVNQLEPAPEPEEEPPATAGIELDLANFTMAIKTASGKKLADQTLPALTKSPRGTMPQLGQRPIAQEIYNILLTEQPVVPESELDKKDQERLKKARELLDPIKPPEVKEGAGAAVTLQDKGPQPIKPLPEGQATDVKQIVARLLAQPDDAAKDVLKRMRDAAFPNKSLSKAYPDIGSDKLAALQGELTGELKEIAAAAGISGTDLDAEVAKRKEELEKEKQDAQKKTEDSGKEATKAVGDAGQEKLDAIAGAKDAVDEEVFKRQEAAGGSADPAVVNGRRDKYIGKVRERVTVQTSNYQNAGEERDQKLSEGERDQKDAYKFTAQQDEYQIKRHPAEGETPEQIEARAAEIRAWADEQSKSVGEAVRKLKKAAGDETKANRKAVEDAGTKAIHAAEGWAEEKLSAGKSWWDRFWTMLKRWFGVAQETTVHWEVKRTKQTRDGIVKDAAFIRALQEKAAAGVDEATILQDQKLTDEQRAIVSAFFQSEGKMHPLDLAAMSLRMRLTNNHRARYAAEWEGELLGKSDPKEWEKLETIGRAQSGGFSADKVAVACHGAMDQLGTDEDAVYRNLNGLTKIQLHAVRLRYRAEWGKSIDQDIEDEFSGQELDRAQALMRGDQGDADAIALDDALTAWGGLNTDEKAVMDLLRNKTPEEVEKIKAAYEKRFGKSLEQGLKDDLDEGNEQDQATALMNGDTATADAIALDEAMRGGFMGWGTSEEEIEGTYNRVREEVKAQAAREGWNTAQMKAEIKRRNAAIEAKFNVRYKDVEQYNSPEGGDNPSVLKRAFKTEMSGPELDLAEALQDNDLAKADAARIRIEEQSLIYASDEKINNVLQSQYERALEDTRRDQGPARQLLTKKKIEDEVKAETERREKADPPLKALTPDELSEIQMRHERAMQKDMEESAKGRSKAYTDAMTNAFNNDPRYRTNLDDVITKNMSGSDRDKARDLVAQGGWLTPYQQFDYATKDLGTDEDALKKLLPGMTKAEIDKLKKEWEGKHPGENFDSFLRSEVSGRDEFDLMDAVEHGAPEKASDKAEQLKRRMKYELEEGGLLGGAAAGAEQSWLKERGKILEEKAEKLKNPTEDAEKRQEILDEFNLEADRVDGAIEDTRRAVDSFTNMATMIVGAIVGVAVGILTAGALGPVMAALVASLASTVATMATKRLIQGDAYGIEDIGVDAAVGLVDAVASIATAGLAKGLLGTAVKGAPKAIPKGRVAMMVAKLGKVPGLSRINQMESGFLVKGVSGTGRLAKMAQSNSKFVQILAEGMAETLENVAQSAPSALAGTLMNDQTWKGNPGLNIIEGTFMQVGQGAVMGLGFQVGSGAFGKTGAALGGIFKKLKGTSPDASFIENNSMLRAMWDSFKKSNPDATAKDFAKELDNVRTQMDAQGKLPPEAKPPRETAPRADADTGTAPRKADVEPTPVKSVDGDTGVAPRPDADVEGKAQALKDALPEKMRDKIPVEVDPKLEGKTVKVEYDKVDGQITNVRIVAGPDARPIDIMMHAPTARKMQSYVGLLGRVRTLMERFKAWYYMEPHLKVGSKAWEANLELNKLFAVIDERMEMLRKGNLDPEAQAKLQQEIDSLSKQIDMHQKTLNDLDMSEGRGFVAAEEKVTPEAGKAPPTEAELNAQIRAEQAKLRAAKKTHSALEADSAQKIDAQNSKVNDQKVEVQKAQKEVDEWKGFVDDLNKSNAKQSEIEAANKELQAAAEKHTEALKELDTRQKALEQLQTSHDLVVKTAENEQALITDQINSLQDLKPKPPTEADIVRQGRRIDSLKFELDELEGRLETEGAGDVFDKRKPIEKRLERLEKQAEPARALEEAIGEQKKTLQQLDDEIAKRQGDPSALQQRNQLAAELATKQAQLEKSRDLLNLIDEQEKLLKGLDEEIAKRQADPEVIKKRAELNAELGAKELELQKARDDLTAMNKHFERDLAGVQDRALKEYSDNYDHKFEPLEKHIDALGLTPAERAMLRKYSLPIAELCKGLTDAQVADRLKKILSGLNPADLKAKPRANERMRQFNKQYEDFYRNVRNEILKDVGNINGATKAATNELRTKALNRFSELIPETGSKGALWGDYREQYLKFNPESKITPVTEGARGVSLKDSQHPLSEGGVGKGRDCDGIVEVSDKINKPKDAQTTVKDPMGQTSTVGGQDIEPGKYMAEDKAGSSKDYKQALDYHRMLNRDTQPPQTIRTPDLLDADGVKGKKTTQFTVGTPTGTKAGPLYSGGQAVKGVIYFHQDKKTAQALANFLNGCKPPLDARIHVAYINPENGSIEWIR